MGAPHQPASMRLLYPPCVMKAFNRGCLRTAGCGIQWWMLRLGISLATLLA